MPILQYIVYVALYFIYLQSAVGIKIENKPIFYGYILWVKNYNNTTLERGHY